MGAIKTLNLKYIEEKYSFLKDLKKKSGYSNWEDFIYDTILKIAGGNR